MIGGIFNLSQWGDWAVRSLIVLGSGTFVLFCVMQWNPQIEATINLPTIQHVFAKR